MYDLNEFLETLKTTRVYNYCKEYVSLGYEFCIIYFIWIVLHYIASHLYTRMCTHFSFIGFISSPFLVPAPLAPTSHKNEISAVFPKAELK